MRTRNRKVGGRDLWANEVTAANAGEGLGFAVKSRVALSLRPGVVEFCR